jgi:hypothetical protein
LSHCWFSSKNAPQVKYHIFSNLIMMTPCRQPFLPLIMHIPHKHVPIASQMCRSNKVFENGK